MKEAKEERKEPAKPIVMVPEKDSTGHVVFKCLNKENADSVKDALIHSSGVKVKAAEKNTCPLEPNKPYEKSICKKIDKLFEKSKKIKEKEK